MNAIFQNHKGQTLVEYSLLLGIIIAVLLTLNPMIKRSTQGMVKIVSDELGYQQNSEQKEGPGLLEMAVRTNLDRQQQKQEWYAAGVHSAQTSYNEMSTVNTQTHSDLGFTAEE